MTDVTASESNAQPAAANARGRWWLPRFQLSTFLSATAVACIAAAWWFRATPIHTTYSDGALVYSRTEPQEGGEDLLTGDYLIIDTQGRVMLRGSHRQGIPVGTWTSYYKSGYRSATGPLKAGSASGAWTYWAKNGRRRAVIAYERPSDSLTSPSRETTPKWRHGKASYWHASNGTRAATGEFRNNRRAGAWSFWDDQGALIAEGSYVDGQRQGAWRVMRDGKLADVFFLNDTPVGDPQAVAKRLEQASSRVRDGAAAWGHDLSELSAYAVSNVQPLARSLMTANPAVQSLVLQALAKQGRAAGVPEAVQRATELLDSPSPAVRRDAAVCLLAIDGANAETLLDEIASSTYGPIRNLKAPYEQIAETLDIEVVEKLLGDSAPPAPVRVRRLLARIVAAGFVEAQADGRAANARSAALVQKVMQDPDTDVAGTLNERLYPPAFGTPPGIFW